MSISAAKFTAYGLGLFVIVFSFVMAGCLIRDVRKRYWDLKLEWPLVTFLFLVALGLCGLGVVIILQVAMSEGI